MNPADKAEVPPPLPPPPPPLITSRAEFQAAVKWAVQAAAARPARQLWWVSTDFVDWPLSESSLLAELSAWLRLPQRRLVLLAASYAELPRRHPRFVAWRRDWAHAIDCFTPAPELALQLPSLLVDDGPVCLHLIDAPSWRARAFLDPRVARTWRGEIDVVLQRSEASFPVNQLGL